MRDSAREIYIELARPHKPYCICGSFRMKCTPHSDEDQTAKCLKPWACGKTECKELLKMENDKQ